MAEIILAADRRDFMRLREVPNSLLDEVLGVKILPDDGYSYHARQPAANTTGESVARQITFPAACRLARDVGAKTIMLDTRFAHDKPEEVEASVRTVVSEMRVPPKRMDLKVRPKGPDFLTIHHDVPQDTMVAFAVAASRYHALPVCHITSSRFSRRDYELRGLNAEENAKKMAEFIVSEASGVGSVICAAADARVVKEAAPELKVFATGATLSMDDDFNHPRPALAEKVAAYVDTFIVGSTILASENPADQLERWQKLLAK